MQLSAAVNIIIMVVSCSAINCRERHQKDGPYTFHRFPQEQTKRAAWLKALNRENFTPSKSSRVCSRHFTPDSFFKSPQGKHKLKDNAVPTIFDAKPVKKPRKVRKDKNVKRCELKVNGVKNPCMKKSSSHTKEVTVKEEPIDDENFFENDSNSYILPCDTKSVSYTKEVSVVLKEGPIHDEHLSESDSDSYILPCNKNSSNFTQEMTITLKKEPLDDGNASEEMVNNFNAEPQEKYIENDCDSFKLPHNIAAQLKKMNELNEVLKKKADMYQSLIKDIMECCCKCKCHDILDRFTTELLQQPLQFQ